MMHSRSTRKACSLVLLLASFVLTAGYDNDVLKASRLDAAAVHSPPQPGLLRWKRDGFAEAWALATADLNGDGHDEVVYGGRGLAALGGDTVHADSILWNVEWTPAPADNVLDGGDNSWATGLAVVEATSDDVPDLLVTTSDTDAYLVDGATGAKLWHNERLPGFGLSAGFALIDANADDVPDMFPTGSYAAISGKTGEVLWSAPVPRARRAASADLDGDGARDVIVGTSPPGVGTDPATWGDALTAETVFGISSRGEVLFSFAPTSGVRSVTAADLDGDGVDEAIIGTYTGILYAVNRDGTLRWSTAPGPGRVDALAATDVDGDGREEVLLSVGPLSGAPAPFAVAAYGDGGVLLWQHPVEEPIGVLQPAQLDEDPALELLAGGGSRSNPPTSGLAVALETGPLSVIRERWRVVTYQEVQSFALASRHGRRVVVIGSADARLRAVDPTTGGSIWTNAVGDYVTSVAAGDLDGDGADEAVSGDASGHVSVSDNAGNTVWFQRLDVGGSGSVMDVAIGDVEQDGIHEVVAGGERLGAEEGGVVALYAADGSERWSRRLAGWAEDVAVVDLRADGVQEILVAESDGLDGPCHVNAFDSNGVLLWRTFVAACLIPAIDAADIDRDGYPEIVFGSRTLFAQPHVALLDGAGTVVWNVGITEQVFWIQAIPGGLVHGGFGVGARGNVTRRTVGGAVSWQIVFPDDPDFGSGSRFGTLVPDTDGDDVFELAASGDDGAVRLLDGRTGAIRWSTRLESADRPHTYRHQAGPLVYAPAEKGRPAALLAAQYGIHRKRAEALFLNLEGRVLDSVPLQGEAHDAAFIRFADGVGGAVVGAGLGVYAIEQPGPGKR